ncbi:YdbH domain-containing protein [Candidatus Methylobacter favarea]|uniref:YdbH domain-containing protein n=1 Tax=Candidatus Methylobacter favarea TaxID=2707345 RepID=UPI001FEABD58|nr:YdbH domain-containing protein [Candidatus Methylobacter favarea]
MDAVSINAGVINFKNWKLAGVNIALTDLTQSPQKLALTIDQLSLPKPFNDLKLVNIRCTAFSWRNEELLCRQGRAKIHSKRWQSPSFNFSFLISQNRTSLKLTGLQLAGGTFAVDGDEQGNQWRLQVNAKAVDGRLIRKLLQLKSFDPTGGKISFKLDASGSQTFLKTFSLNARLDGLTVQTKDGRFATESLTLKTHVNAQNHKNGWRWQNQSSLIEGALYIEPLYLDAGKQSISWDAQGRWDEASKRIEIQSANYSHSLAADLSGNGIVSYKDGVNIEKADLSLRSEDLQLLSSVYLKPFFEQTAWEGVSLAGNLQADFSIVQQSLTALSAAVSNLEIKDAAGRAGVRGGVGTINWSVDESFDKPSDLSWQQLNVRNLPIGPARLLFLSKANSFKVLEKTRLPFLGGTIAINQFSLQAKKQQEPEIYFDGNMSNVSLEQLSRALNWTPLSGTISGAIPGVTYRDKTLRLGGELIIKVFDGAVKISNLAASGLFTDISRFHSDVEIDNLDLEQLTGKFKFGSITGKLSGFVRELTLENWRPLSFFAWLGTPDDDDSTHRISQKAVKSIASIGGGGAAGVLSRSFLSLFETFGYGKLGLGCYLHDGVCQLMGVEATGSGYAIITGGGLPRINVIGYNPQVDWDVLMERLSRITASDEVIIE